MRKILTPRYLDGLSVPAGGRLEVFDANTPGLALRVGERTKTWIALVRVRGKLRRLTLGRYPKPMSLAKAREAARAARTQAEAGIDPAAEKAAAKAPEAPPADTFGELVSLYLTQHAKRHKRTWKEDARILAKDFADWNAVPVRDLTRRMIRERLDELAARAPVQANRSLAALSTVLNFGVDREWLDANPAARLKKPTVEVSRERVLTDDEIRDLWLSLDAADRAYRTIADADRRVTVKRLDDETPLLRPLFVDWLRLRLLTAQRGGEVLRMRREDVDLKAGVWTVPATVAKNKQAHLVPLSPAALAIVERRLTDVDDGCPWLFPNDRNTGPATDRAKKVKLARLLPSSADVRGHDLRRTAASGMGRLGVTRETIARVLNHVDRGPRSTSVYDRFDRLPEKRAAIVRWAEEVSRIVKRKTRKAVCLAR